MRRPASLGRAAAVRRPGPARMSGSAKCWRLALVAGLSECLAYAEAKYCAFESHGVPNYYVCPKTEYCCNHGCCVSPGFQMYHLWYYWLLVIIMFLVCSGGGWWYRYWFHGRYRTTASAIPSRSPGARAQSSMRDPSCRAQQARISYNTARNTVLLHRMWKAPGQHRGVVSSAYGGPGPVSSAGQLHYQNTSVVLNDVSCPYYQLYGPPPSYETVIAQSRGKLSSPSSPELLRGPGQSRLPEAGCFYGPRGTAPTPPPPTSLPSPGLEAPRYQPSCSPPARTRFVDALLMLQRRWPADVIVADVLPGGPTTIVSSSPRHQPGLQQLEAVRCDRPPVGPGHPEPVDAGETGTSCSRPTSPDDGGFAAAGMDCLGSPCAALDRQLPCYASAGKMPCRLGVHGSSRRSGVDRWKCEPEPLASTSSSQFRFESCAPSSSSSCSAVAVFGQRGSGRSELRKGGSLKIPRRHQTAASIRQQQQQQQQQELARQRLSSADYCPGARADCPPPEDRAQPIPSSTSSGNVIAGPRPEPDEPPPQRHRQAQGPAPLAQPIAERSSTNSNAESKRKKLDRSKSLD